MEGFPTPPTKKKKRVVNLGEEGRDIGLAFWSSSPVKTFKKFNSVKWQLEDMEGGTYPVGQAYC
jgi:hypothetical protein